MSPSAELYAAIESELSAEMGLDLECATSAARRRLATAVALALRIDQDQGRLRDGVDVDLKQHIADQSALTELLEASPADDQALAYDLDRLSDGEAVVLERLLAKAFGVAAYDFDIDPSPEAVEARRLCGSFVRT